MKLSCSIHKPVELIYDYLSDMQKFVAVHPVITKIEKNTGGSYKVYETLHAAGIPISFTYPVTIESQPQQNRVVMRATVMKTTSIEMIFVLTPGDGCTKVEEEIQFKSPLPVRAILENIFRKQHLQLFRNIEGLKPLLVCSTDNVQSVPTRCRAGSYPPPVELFEALVGMQHG